MKQQNKLPKSISEDVCRYPDNHDKSLVEYVKRHHNTSWNKYEVFRDVRKLERLTERLEDKESTLYSKVSRIEDRLNTVDREIRNIVVSSNSNKSLGIGTVESFAILIIIIILIALLML